MRLHTTHGTNLNLPWGLPLSAWPNSAEIDGGRRVVMEGGARYVVQEMNKQSAEQVFTQMETLAGYNLPTAPAVGYAMQRGDDLPDLLLMRWPEDTHLLREVLAGGQSPETISRALATLTAHLHLAGYRLGADALRHCLISGDGSRALLGFGHLTGSFCDDIQTAARNADLLAATVNLTALAADAGIDRKQDGAAARFAESVTEAYGRIWERIAQTRVFFDDAEVQVRTRVTPFAALESPVQQQVKAAPGNVMVQGRVTSGGDHRLMLHTLTGLDARDEGSRLLLRDLFRYHGFLEFTTGRKWPRGLAANRWMVDVYQPALAGLARLKAGEACY